MCVENLKKRLEKNLKIVDKNTTKANACITAQHSMDLMFFRGSFTNLILHGWEEQNAPSSFFRDNCLQKKDFCFKSTWFWVKCNLIQK